MQRILRTNQNTQVVPFPRKTLQPCMSPLGPRGTHCTECLAAHSLSTSPHGQATEHTLTPGCPTLRARLRPVSNTRGPCLLATLCARPNMQNTCAMQSNAQQKIASTSIGHKRFPIRFSRQLAAPRLNMNMRSKHAKKQRQAPEDPRSICTLLHLPRQKHPTQACYRHPTPALPMPTNEHQDNCSLKPAQPALPHTVRGPPSLSTHLHMSLGPCTLTRTQNVWSANACGT